MAAKSNEIGAAFIAAAGSYGNKTPPHVTYIDSIQMDKTETDKEFIFEATVKDSTIASSFYPNFVEITLIPDYALKTFEIWMKDMKVCHIPFSVLFAFGKILKCGEKRIVCLSDILLGRQGDIPFKELLNARLVKYVVRCDNFSDVTLPPNLPIHREDLDFYVPPENGYIKIFTQYNCFGKDVPITRGNHITHFRSFETIDGITNDQGIASFDLKEKGSYFSNNLKFSGIVVFTSDRLFNAKLELNGHVLFDYNDTLLMVKGTYAETELPECRYRPRLFMSWQAKDSWFEDSQNKAWISYLDEKFKDSKWSTVVYIPIGFVDTKITDVNSNNVLDFNGIKYADFTVKADKNTRVRVMPAYINTVVSLGDSVGPLHAHSK